MSLATIRQAGTSLQKHRVKAASSESKLIHEIRSVPTIELARAIGMSAQYVCDVKKGRRQVGDGMLEKLMAGLA
jgi:hypothetical protein